MNEIATLGKFERLMRVFSPATYHVNRTIELLSRDVSHEEILSTIPQGTSDSWNEISTIHKVVVAHDLERAFNWLYLVTEMISAAGDTCSTDFLRGAYLGVLSAGVWLDEEKSDVEFRRSILEKLAMSIVRSDLSTRRFDENPKFDRQLSNAISTFVSCPRIRKKPYYTSNEEQFLTERLKSAEDALRCIANARIPDPLDPLKTLFVKRLAQAVFSNYSPLKMCQIIAGTQKPEVL
jgi:hypothetical protein